MINDHVIWKSYIASRIWKTGKKTLAFGFRLVTLRIKLTLLIFALASKIFSHIWSFIKEIFSWIPWFTLKLPIYLFIFIIIFFYFQGLKAAAQPHSQKLTNTIDNTLWKLNKTFTFCIKLQDFGFFLQINLAFSFDFQLLAGFQTLIAKVLDLWSMINLYFYRQSKLD